jgi:hypothetical protein
MPNSPENRTYAERYCERHKIPTERFPSHLLRRSLHAPLRWYWPLISRFSHTTNELDWRCVEAVGRLRNRDSVYSELAEFGYNPGNLTFWRRRLRQRLSTRRLMRALRDLPK